MKFFFSLFLVLFACGSVFGQSADLVDEPEAVINNVLVLTTELNRPTAGSTPLANLKPRYEKGFDFVEEINFIDDTAVEVRFSSEATEEQIQQIMLDFNENWNN